MYRTGNDCIEAWREKGCEAKAANKRSREERRKSLEILKGVFLLHARPGPIVHCEGAFGPDHK